MFVKYPARFFFPLKGILLVNALLGFAAVAPLQASDQVRIVLAGDSTVTGKASSRDEAGWGWALQQWTKPDARVFNEAVGGRSSRSFRSEGRWERVMRRQPQWVLIQFGHNDQPGKGPERESDAQTDYPDHLRRYIAEARAAGTKPVLLTPVCRRTFKDGKLTDTLEPYAQAARRVAEETGTPLLDLHAYSHRKFSEMGPEESAKLGPLDAPTDRTHFSTAGSAVVAGWVLDMLNTQVPELAQHFERPAAAPAAACH